MPIDLDDRINELEIRFTHQSRLLEELDQIAVDFGARILQLEKENSRLRQLIQGMAPEMKASPDEK